jgi:hypothetical protein
VNLQFGHNPKTPSKIRRYYQRSIDAERRKWVRPDDIFHQSDVESRTSAIALFLPGWAAKVSVDSCFNLFSSMIRKKNKNKITHKADSRFLVMQKKLWLLNHFFIF